MSAPEITIAIGAEPNDPLATMLGNDLAAQGLHPVPLDRAEAPTRVLFTSQTAFLANLLFDLPEEAEIEIILRRATAAQTASEWATGLHLLRQVLRRQGARQITLSALTEVTARECAAILETDVALHSEGHDPEVRLAHGVIHETRDEIVFPQGRMQASVWNWARLRRRANLSVATGASDDMHDLVAFLNLAYARVPQKAPAFLFVVPNGVGLGHLTRMLAIADSLREGGAGEIRFWCFSQGAGIIQAAGYPVHYRMTARHLHCRPEDWHGWEVSSLRAILEELRPEAVVLDGSAVDLAVSEAIRTTLCCAPEIVWIRRAMWQKGSSAAEGLEGAQLASLILEPGDLAAAADTGATVTYKPARVGLSKFAVTPPVTLTQGNAPLPRREARRALGLRSFARKLCLVSLGGDAFSRQQTVVEQIVASARRANVRLIWARSPLARIPSDLIDEADMLHVYPLGRFFAAFDGAISACGYNSFHELLQTTSYPLMFVPVQHQKLDDQAARARYAAQEGWSDTLEAESPQVMAERLDRFFQQVRAGAQNGTRPRVRNGASEMADRILAVVEPEEVLA